MMPMKTNDIKTINAHQQQIYDEFEKETAAQLIEGYVDILTGGGGGGNTLKILDIGGGGGYFALSLRSYFSDEHCEIFVVDTTQYDTWKKYANQVTFVNASAENLSKLFREETFDLVFANRVFHHFVRNSWSESFNGMADIAKQVAFILKKDGFFCITDYFYDGWLHHTLTSKILYTLTSIKFAPVATLFRKLDAKTAGVGVCFLSKKMWFNLFAQAGFIVSILKKGRNFKLPWYQKLGSFNKSSSEDNVIILRKEE
jgi:ubiquinone/menaquinone biosynthesis C-methylase UbiE